MTTHVKYTLPPEIRAELEALPAPTAPNYLNELQCASIEVVVTARRLAANKRLRDEIDSILVDRATKLVRAAVNRHGGVPFRERDDAVQEAMFLFWREIQSESFFEVRFNLALMYLAMQAGRTIRGGNQGEFERSVLSIGPPDSDEPANRGAPVDIAYDVDEHSRFEDRDLVEVGLASLTEEQAKALTLHYELGLQIYSHDSEVRTVASVLGCGERKARKLIADGKATLRRSIGQEDCDE